MLGYTEKEIAAMADAQRIMLIQINQNKLGEQVVHNLIQTFHLLEGLLAEGRI